MIFIWTEWSFCHNFTCLFNYLLNIGYFIIIIIIIIIIITIIIIFIGIIIFFAFFLEKRMSSPSLCFWSICY